MKEERKIKIIQTISDYDEACKDFLNGAIPKNELTKAEKTAMDKLEKMKLNLEERIYIGKLLKDIWKKIFDRIMVDVNKIRVEESMVEELRQENHGCSFLGFSPMGKERE